MAEDWDRYQRIKTTSRKVPETRREAANWETAKNKYLAAGLCYRCAAQAAWGIQNGWGTIHPPCRACAPVVAAFPQPVRGSVVWRRLPPKAWGGSPRSPRPVSDG